MAGGGTGDLPVHHEIAPPPNTHKISRKQQEQWSIVKNPPRTSQHPRENPASLNHFCFCVICSYTVVHRTEVKKSTLNPSWLPFSVTATMLCNGDYDR